MTPPRDSDDLGTIHAALGRALARDPARPLVTWIGGEGLRTELSVRTFENNVAKAANLLVDDVDAQPGTVVVLRLPAHWQTAVWLAACAAVGAIAWLDGDAGAPDVELAVLGPDSLDDGRAPLTLATSLHPFGLPFAVGLPSGVGDAAIEVRAHGDRFSAPPGVTGSSAWLRVGDATRSQQEALAAGRALADRVGLPAEGRLLCAGPWDDDTALALVALPLAVDGSVVVLTDPDADVEDVAARERCDAILR